MSITLTVTQGPHQGRSFTFADHDTFIVGRSPQAHFSLGDQDRYFSRMHFLVEVNPPLCRLLDLGSHNGTLVNGQQVKSADLHDGDHIQAGHTVLRVSLRHKAPALSTLAPGAASSRRPPRPAGSAVPASLPTLSTVAPGAASSRRPPRLAGSAVPASLPTLSPENCLPEAPADDVAIPGYRVLRELGRGGMGVVYQVVRESDGSVVALKTIRPAVSPQHAAVERFLREANILRGLTHPHIVSFRDMGESGGLLWFAMDFIPGTDAARLVQQQGPLAIRQAVGIVCEGLDALAFAHARGFVHRDVKPANILLAPLQGRELVKLADFGLARTYQSSELSGLTMAGTMGGTPSFVPPEQILDFRSVKPAADQYSAAATLYHLLTGGWVYDPAGGTQEILKRILLSEPIPIRDRRGDLPPALAAVIHRALARQPADRFPDVAGLRKALLPFAG